MAAPTLAHARPHSACHPLLCCSWWRWQPQWTGDAQASGARIVARASLAAHGHSAKGARRLHRSFRLSPLEARDLPGARRPSNLVRPPCRRGHRGSISKGSAVCNSSRCEGSASQREPPAPAERLHGPERRAQGAPKADRMGKALSRWARTQVARCRRERACPCQSVSAGTAQRRWGPPLLWPIRARLHSSPRFARAPQRDVPTTSAAHSGAVLLPRRSQPIQTRQIPQWAPQASRRRRQSRGQAHGLRIAVEVAQTHRRM